MGKISRNEIVRKKMKRKYYKLTKTAKGRSKRRAKSNPFFNFLRDFRRENSTLSVTEIAIRGAKRWHKMSDQEKRKYYRVTASSTRKARRHRRKRIKDKDKNKDKDKEKDKDKDKDKANSKTSHSKSKSKTRSAAGSSAE